MTKTGEEIAMDCQMSYEEKQVLMSYVKEPRFPVGKYPASMEAWVIHKLLCRIQELETQSK